MDYIEAKRQAYAELEARKGKPWTELEPWKDYDPILIDNRARELMNPNVRFMGD